MDIQAILLWLQNAVVAGIVYTITFLSREVSTPLWLLLVTFMAGMLFSRARGIGGRATKAYQRIRVKWAR